MSETPTRDELAAELIAHGEFSRLGEMRNYENALACADAILAMFAPQIDALKALLPPPLCGESWNLPDDEFVTIDTTFGKLKRARQALSISEEGKP